MKRHLHLVLIAAIAGAIAAGAMQTLFSARAAQDELVPPTSGVYSGVQFSQLLGDAFRSLASCNKGSTAPANVGGSAVDGLCWIDDSVTPWLKKRYADGAWVVEGAIDPDNALWVGAIGGGIATIASASTVDLGAVPQANVSITGTTDIGSFGSSAVAGAIKIVRFADTLTLTHSSSLKVPGGYSIATAADDRAVVTHLGSGTWEVTSYTRASGIPVDVAAVGGLRFTMADAPSALEVYGAGQALTRTSYPAYLAKVTRAQNGTRTSGSATLTSVADTQGLGAGMPIEGAGIPAGTTISSVTTSTIVMSANATSSGTGTVTVFPTGYGSGGSASTVGVADCQSRLIAGRDAPTGTATDRITSAGSGVNSRMRNATGGAQTVDVTVGQTNLPNVNFTVSGITLSAASNISQTAGGSTIKLAGMVYGTGGDAAIVFGTSFSNPIGTFVDAPLAQPAQTVTAQGSAASGGSGAAITFNKLPPVGIADCIVRVLP